MIRLLRLAQIAESFRSIFIMRQETLEGLRDAVRCAKERIAEWWSGTAGICEPEELQEMAAERYRAKVVEALREYVETLQLGVAQKVELRREIRAVICPCGASYSSRDVCVLCSREALPPVAYVPMLQRLARAKTTAQRNYRRAELRRHPQVMRVVRN